jgi:hypothetical protein
MSQPTIYSTAGARGMDRAAVAAAEAEAAEKKATADLARVQVERERAMLAQQLRREEAETRRAEQVQAAREAKLAQDLKDAARTKAEAEKAAKAAKRRAWLTQRRALIMTVVVIAASMGIAWPAQASYFMGAGMGLLGLAAPIVIEGPQWLSAILTGRAVHSGASTWVYQLSTGLFAGLAAAINYVHGARQTPLLGVIYALASLMGVVAWELYVHSAKAHLSGRTVADRKRDLGRRISYPGTWRAAVRMRRAVSGLDTETAWTLAWRARHGADPGITATMLREQNEAMAAVMQAYERRSVTTLPGRQWLGLRLAESGLGLDAVAWRTAQQAPGSLTRTSPPATPVTQDTKSQATRRIPPTSAQGRKGVRTPLSTAARKAASVTARQAQADPQTVAQLRIRAAQRYAAAKAAGEELTWEQLGAEFERTEGWARLAVKKHGGLQVAPGKAA